MLAHGFEFGGEGGAVGGLCCEIQHHLLPTCPEGLTTFYTDCNKCVRSACKMYLLPPDAVVG